MFNSIFRFPIKEEKPQVELDSLLPTAHQISSAGSFAPMADVFYMNQTPTLMVARKVEVYREKDSSCCFCCFKTHVEQVRRQERGVELAIHSIIR